MKTVHVAVAVIENSAGECLIAQRHHHQHMGGYWEFPGGKVEAQETVFQALQREIREEVALEIHRAEPLLRIPFSYPEKQVLLDVWRVTNFSGTASSAEGQTVRWVSRSALSSYSFPPANRAILTALHLPQCLLVTGAFQTPTECLQRTQCAIEQKNIRAVILRAHHLDRKNFSSLAEQMAQLCQAHDAKLLLNAAADCALGAADGLHLSSQRLMACVARPIDNKKYLGASCHNAQEIQQAVAIGADYITLSPVLPTASHPDQAALGWEGLAQLLKHCPLPVFALGGTVAEHLPKAREMGAWGIAGISAWW